MTLLEATKRCRTCGIEKGIQQFKTYTTTAGRELRLHSCSDCGNHRARKRQAAIPLTPERARRLRERSMIRMYGITIEQYEQMQEAQGNLCAICARPETRVVRGALRPLCVDHDHETGKVRGLLCSNCNLAIGLLNSGNLLTSAILYLGE